jgi:hypothetical protein
MTLATYAFGVILALCIAKYNKSNKLFWILFTAITLGFAGTKMLYDTFGNKKQNEVSLKQAYPTQGLPAMGNAFVCVTDNISDETLETTSNPVGQVNTPDYVENTLTLSYVPGVTHGIYLHMLANPPNMVEIVNDS